MMVPSQKLVFWTGAVLVPCALVLAVSWALLLPVLCVVLAFALLIVVDALRSRGLLHEISVALPDDIRLSKDRESTVALAFAQTHPVARRIRVGLSWPASFMVEDEAVSVELEAKETQEFVWPVTPRERGDYALEAVYLETDSAQGFWKVRDTRDVACRLRVYPNLRRERKQLAAVFLNRGSLGGHARRQVGKGREFEKLREYAPGDGYEDIHWKATARHGMPITKDYQIERTQEVYVVLDASRLSARVAPGEGAGTTESALERMIHAAMAMGLVAEKQGDHFGLLTFSDQIHTFVRARNGQAHYSGLREALYRLQPNPVNPDFDEVCTFIRTRLRRRALVVFLTNLDDPVLSESFASALRLLTRRHLVVVNTITAGDIEALFKSDDVDTTGDIYRKLAGHLQWHDLQEVRRALHHQGVDLHLTNHASLTTALVSQYMDVKQRQAL